MCLESWEKGNDKCAGERIECDGESGVRVDWVSVSASVSASMIAS